MNNRILFLIYNGEIKFLSSNIMDHREWFRSLGGKDEDYETLIRGFIMNNMIIFVKGTNLSYDSNVIDVAKKCGPIMKQQLQRPELKIACGVLPGENGDKWEPIMIINEEAQATQQQQNTLNKTTANADENIINFRNNSDDPMFALYAIRFTLIMLIATVVSKFILIARGILAINSLWNILLVFAQIVCFILCIDSYNKKNENYKLYGLIATVALFFMFDLIDIIIGVLNLMFIIDQKYIINLLRYMSEAKEKGKKIAARKSLKK